MQIILDNYEDYLIVKFNGELDHHTSEDARKKIDDWYHKKSKKNIILDLSNVNFMDSSGIGLVMGRYRNVKDNGGELKIVNSSDLVNKILRMSGIEKIINIYGTLELALHNK